MQKIISFFRNIIPLSWRIKFGPYFAWISYIFNLYIPHGLKKLKVLSLDQTLDKIANEELSFIRFGDGEMSLIDNINLAFQENNQELAQRLKEVLCSKNPKLLICIPGIFGKMDLFNKKTFRFNLHHLFKHGYMWRNLLSADEVYGEAFISRPYLLYKDINKSEEVFKKFFSLWKDKDVVLIEGEKTRLGVGNDLFKEAKSIGRILGPSENAFSKLESLKTAVLSQPKDKLILLSLGPAAKILAFDLFKEGYRVMDIGHIDMEYEMFLRKSPTIVKVPFKYFNEIGERTPDECHDDKYTNEIIAKIT